MLTKCTDLLHPVRLTLNNPLYICESINVLLKNNWANVRSLQGFVQEITSLCIWFLAHKRQLQVSPKGMLNIFVVIHETYWDEVLHPCTDGIY
jgi:hypothetical protein